MRIKIETDRKRFTSRLKALKLTPLTLIWPFFSRVARSTGIKGLGVKGG